MRVGFGYDVHKLAEDRKCILCGVDIPHDKGLLGHSDADVAIHALCDAILGAASMGDIGRYFPDNVAEYKDIDSRILLREVVKYVTEKGYKIENVDITIAAQKPKIMPYIKQMCINMSSDLKIDADCVNIKGTTTEKLGFEGREEGISAYAVVLIEKS